MKKFLIIFLISAIICSNIEKNINLKGKYSKVNPAIARRLYNALEKSGMIDVLKKIYQTSGKEAAIDACAKSISRSLCEGVVDLIEI